VRVLRFDCDLSLPSGLVPPREDATLRPFPAPQELHFEPGEVDSSESGAGSLPRLGARGGKWLQTRASWLKRQPELAIADITQDWAEALLGISEAGSNAFYDWLSRQGRPTNVVDFFAERDKRRGRPPREPDVDD
jgi:hypothetical protein